MKGISDKVVRIGFGLSLLLLGSIALLAVVSVKRSLSQLRWAEHTLQVIDLIDATMLGMTEAEAGRRGYILSREIAFFGDYNRGLTAAQQNLAELRQLTQDNPTQQERLDRLEPLMAERLNLLQQSMSVAQQRSGDTATQQLITQQSIAVQQNVRQLLWQMEKAEYRLLERRSSAVERYMSRSLLLAGLGLGLSFTLLGMVYWLLHRQIWVRQQAELALSQANQQLATLNKTLVDSNQDLEQFAYVASHDLQEPLRAVAGYTQLLTKEYGDRFDSTAQLYTTYIVDGAKRMQQLIQDLLTYSRIGSKDLNLSLVNMNELVALVQQNLEVAIAESDATITSDTLPTIVGDRSQLLQLLQNLISNAIKFRAEHPPHIHILVSGNAYQWQFGVQDNGIGIKSQYLERIFEIFKRLHTRTEYSGTGIGLAICKKIVNRHGGSIWAESTPDVGTTIHFTIPAQLDLSCPLDIPDNV
ncbi:sensor histidine kinase [Leptolyngbya sp. AN02str]|uniref:sensor histidine kinase n=1 Tax=Leptolyngbya sp. AN02str TaxID=3423363 RepID=UPI003D31D9AA